LALAEWPPNPVIAMNTADFGFLVDKVTWYHVALVAALAVAARASVVAVRWALQGIAERASPRHRLTILRMIPVIRIAIGVGAVMVAVPILLEPTIANVIALVGSVTFALAFTLKDYASSLAGGLTTILENTYQPGDWIQVDGTYGEVKMIGNRAVHIVTPDDTEVIMPHAYLWSKSVHNATSGKRSLLVVADFYLDPDHDAGAARTLLTGVGESSAGRKQDTEVAVIVLEEPWGTHYRLKAYVEESRRQFQFLSDLTVSGKTALRAAGIRFARAPMAAN
jgi:small conductance mechanosensitive channel